MTLTWKRLLLKLSPQSKIFEVQQSSGLTSHYSNKRTRPLANVILTCYYSWTHSRKYCWFWSHTCEAWGSIQCKTGLTADNCNIDLLLQSGHSRKYSWFWSHTCEVRESIQCKTDLTADNCNIDLLLQLSPQTKILFEAILASLAIQKWSNRWSAQYLQVVFVW